MPVLTVPIQFLLKGSLPNVCFVTGSTENLEAHSLNVLTMSGGILSTSRSNHVMIPFSPEGWRHWGARKGDRIRIWIAYILVGAGTLLVLQPDRPGGGLLMLIGASAVLYIFRDEPLPKFKPDRKPDLVNIIFPVKLQMVYDAYAQAFQDWQLQHQPEQVNREEEWAENLQPGWDQGGDSKAPPPPPSPRPPG